MKQAIVIVALDCIDRLEVERGVMKLAVTIIIIIIFDGLVAVIIVVDFA